MTSSSPGNAGGGDPARALRPGDAVLVTGAAGVVGRTVVARLVGAGYRVVATDRVPFESPGAERRLTGDARDAAHVADALRTADGRVVDGVVHLAAIASPGQAPGEATLTQNVGAAFAVLDGAGGAGVRAAVAASSFSAYGYPWAGRHVSPATAPIDEGQESVAVDAYGLSKLLSEQVAAFVTRRWGMPTTMLRLPFVGAGPRLRGWVDLARRDPGGVRQELWTWLDTRDAADAFRAVLESGVAGHHVVNVAAPDSTSDVPTAELLARFHPATRLTRPIEGVASVIDTAACRALFGFEARRSWRAGDSLDPGDEGTAPVPG